MTIWLNTSFEMRFRVIDGLTIRFAESQAPGDHDALLLSPWPESLLAFEPMWWRLAEQAHPIAIDLPGFGHSQRCDALFSPEAMGEFVISAAAAFGLPCPHVIGPGTGTAKECAEAPSLEELRRADPRQLVTAALSGISRHVLPDAIRDDYMSSYQGNRMAESIRYIRSYAADLPRLSALFPQVAAIVTSWWRGGYAASGSKK